jgi:hypothetical protein
MSSHIDFRTLPASIPSLCIPRVYPNIDERRIRKTFDDLNLGIIERVDIVRKTTEKGEKCNRVFIHFSRWFSSRNADTARERLLNGQDIKVIYDDPWFWKVAAYKEAVEPRREVPNHRIAGEYTFGCQSGLELRPDNNRRDERRRDSSRERSYNRRPEERRRDERSFERRPPRPDGGRMVTYADSRREPPTKEQVDRELDKINIANGNLLAVDKPKPVEAPRQELIQVPPQQTRTKDWIDYNDNRPGLDTNPVAVNYDMNVVNNSKKRTITIKKEEPKKAVKVEDDKEKTW